MNENFPKVKSNKSLATPSLVRNETAGRKGNHIPHIRNGKILPPSPRRSGSLSTYFLIPFLSLLNIIWEGDKRGRKNEGTPHHLLYIPLLSFLRVSKYAVH